MVAGGDLVDDDDMPPAEEEFAGTALFAGKGDPARYDLGEFRRLHEPLTRRLFIDSGFEVKPVPFHKREIFSATEIRKRMISGEKWKELVPKSVNQFIEEIRGVDRLRDLSKTDKIW